MKYLRTSLLTLVMLFVVIDGVLAQEANQSMVSFRNDRVFVGLTNHFSVVAQPGDRYIFTKIRYRCPGQS